MNWKSFKKTWIWNSWDKNKKFYSFDEVFNHPKALIQNIYYFFYRKFWALVDLPCDTKLFILEKYQRARHGWAKSDTWDLSSYLAKVINESIIQLKNDVQGCPMLEGFDRDQSEEEYEKMVKEWHKILDIIIWAFDVPRKMDEDYWIQIFDEKDREELESFYKKIDEDHKTKVSTNHHVMTKEECEKYREGWTLFQKYFFNLWT